MKKIVLSSLIIVSLLFGGWQFVKADQTGDYQLNLSHVYCVGDKVEVHFVLLHAPSDTPTNLVYTYVFDSNQPNVTQLRTVTPDKYVGTTWHFTDYVDSGFVDVKTAVVTISGQKVSLNNPDVYVDTYACAVNTDPTATPTPKTIDEPPAPEATETSTPENIEVTPTSTVVITDELTMTPTTVTVEPTVVTSTPSPTSTLVPTNLNIVGEPPTSIHVQYLPRITKGYDR